MGLWLAVLGLVFPIAAGVTIYHETTPPGLLGALRLVAFGCVVVGAAVVARGERATAERPVAEPAHAAATSEIPIAAPAAE